MPDDPIAVHDIGDAAGIGEGVATRRLRELAERLDAVTAGAPPELLAVVRELIEELAAALDRVEYLEAADHHRRDDLERLDRRVTRLEDAPGVEGESL